MRVHPKNIQDRDEGRAAVDWKSIAARPFGFGIERITRMTAVALHHPTDEWNNAQQGNDPGG